MFKPFLEQAEIGVSVSGAMAVHGHSVQWALCALSFTCARFLQLEKDTSRTYRQSFSLLTMPNSSIFKNICRHIRSFSCLNAFLVKRISFLSLMNVRMFRRFSLCSVRVLGMV